MAHLRKQIREAIATAVTGLTTTSTRVYQSRVYAIDSANLPCLAVYTNEEQSQIDSLGVTRLLQRVLSITIEGRCRATSDVDDTLDAITKEVEVALGTSTLSNLVKDLFLASSTFEISRDAEQPTGLVRMVWMAMYSTPENDPETLR